MPFLYDDSAVDFKVRENGENIEDFLLHCLNELPPDKVDDPTFFIDLGEVVRCYQRFCELLPGVQPFYAVKCNNHHLILKLLASLGSKFDCASKNEIKAVLRAGASPDDIVYANPNKYDTHLVFADEMGVNMLAVDHPGELKKIKKYHQHAKLMLRITGESKSVKQMKRFGATVSECPVIFQTAKDLGMDIVAISFHVGSFIYDKEMFVESIEMASGVRKMAEQYGFCISILDLGGGFPSPSFQNDSPLVQITDSIKTELKERFADLQGIRLICEPGLAIVKSCGIEVFKVVSKRERKLDGDNGKEALAEYVVNDSMHCAMLDIKLVDPFCHVPRPLSVEGKSRRNRLSTLWGYSLSSNDLICEDIQFPDVDPGEHVYVGGRGSYGLVLSTKFNGYGDINIQYYIERSMLPYLSEISSNGKVTVPH